MDASDRYESLHTLTAAQHRGIDAMLAGASHTDAAVSAGVHRVTVSTGVNHHPEFQAELNRRRSDLLAHRSGQLRRADELALAHLIQRIEEGDAAAIAMWFKFRGLAQADTSQVGPTNAEELISQQVDKRFNSASNRPVDDLVVTGSGGKSRGEVRDEVEAALLRRLEES